VDAGNDLRQNFEIHLAFGDDLKRGEMSNG
jgi:hypothetical protein